MPTLDQLIERVQKTKNGFADIRKAAEEIVAEITPADNLTLGQALYASDVHQTRMLATFLFGYQAAASPETLQVLRDVVSRDPDWRVQEILAQAFDHYCADIGYETALPTIEAWITDAHFNVRRAASEGLRIWTSKPYFRDHPGVAIRLLSQLKDDDSEYVRKSAGNALRDISRKFPDLVKAELQNWDASDKKIAQTHRLAGQFLK